MSDLRGAIPSCRHRPPIHSSADADEPVVRRSEVMNPIKENSSYFFSLNSCVRNLAIKRV